MLAAFMLASAFAFAAALCVPDLQVMMICHGRVSSDMSRKGGQWGLLGLVASARSPVHWELVVGSDLHPDRGPKARVGHRELCPQTAAAELAQWYAPVEARQG